MSAKPTKKRMYEILVLDHARIRKCGTHQQLLEGEGLYKRELEVLASSVK